MSARASTPAEALGMTAEIGAAIVAVAAQSLAAGRLAAAREILEGLAVSNPRDPAPWALLATLLRRQGHAEAARLCAEVAARLRPADPCVRLARAESLLESRHERGRGLAELRALTGAADGVGERARALLAAAGG